MTDLERVDRVEYAMSQMLCAASRRLWQQQPELFPAAASQKVSRAPGYALDGLGHSTQAGVPLLMTVPPVIGAKVVHVDQ